MGDKSAISTTGYEELVTKKGDVITVGQILNELHRDLASQNPEAQAQTLVDYSKSNISREDSRKYNMVPYDGLVNIRIFAPPNEQDDAPILHHLNFPLTH